jgi:hypothetical protein
MHLLQAAAAKSGADFYQLLPSRETVVGAKPLGSKLQLALDPLGLQSELDARRDVAALRRRRAQLVQQQRELERREQLRPLTSNAAAVTGGNGAPAFERELSPRDRELQRRRHAELGREWEAERRRRLARITHHAVAPAGRGRPGSAAGNDNHGRQLSPHPPTSGSPPVRRAHSRGRAILHQHSPPPATAAAQVDDGDPDVWPPPPPRPAPSAAKPRPRTSPAHHGTAVAAAGAVAANYGHDDKRGDAAGASDMWVWRPGSAAHLPVADGAAPRACAVGAACCVMCRRARPPSPERALGGLRCGSSPVRRALVEAMADAKRCGWLVGRLGWFGWVGCEGDGACG